VSGFFRSPPFLCCHTDSGSSFPPLPVHCISGRARRIPAAAYRRPRRAAGTARESARAAGAAAALRAAGRSHPAGAACTAGARRAGRGVPRESRGRGRQRAAGKRWLLSCAGCFGCRCRHDRLPRRERPCRRRFCHCFCRRCPCHRPCRRPCRCRQSRRRPCRRPPCRRPPSPCRAARRERGCERAAGGRWGAPAGVGGGATQRSDSRRRIN
jgi:hypothetical protein